MKKKIDLWVAVVAVLAISFGAFIFGAGSAFFYEKSKVDACHRTLKVQAGGLEGLDYSRMSEMKKDYDRCGVKFED